MFSGLRVVCLAKTLSAFGISNLQPLLIFGETRMPSFAVVVFEYGIAFGFVNKCRFLLEIFARAPGATPDGRVSDLPKGRKCLKRLVDVTGFEPATPWLQTEGSKILSRFSGVA
jgi:hypothetical protein